MAVSSDFLAYVLDQLSGLPQLRSRRMFGGVGLYSQDAFFGLLDDDTLYFKVSAENRADYTARGCAQFRPFPDEPIYSMSYFQVPPDVLEDPDELLVWARKAVKVARSKPLVGRRKSAVARAARRKRGARGRS